MGTDRYAYSSRLRRMNPAAKAILSLLALTLCLILGGIAPGVFTLLFMGFLTVFWGKIPFRVFLRFLLVPLIFLLLGCLTIGIGLHPADTPVVAAVPVGGKLLGFTQGSILQMLSICSKSMGVMAAVYFLTLTTSMTDLTQGLSRLRIPGLLIELMELIYRFIFVLWETAGQIRTAQESRLGYRGFSRSLRSLGMLASMVFLRAWKKAGRVYCALESRGYTGTLKTLPEGYEKGGLCFLFAALVLSGQVLCYLWEAGIL